MSLGVVMQLILLYYSCCGYQKITAWLLYTISSAISVMHQCSYSAIGYFSAGHYDLDVHNHIKLLYSDPLIGPWWFSRSASLPIICSWLCHIVHFCMLSKSDIFCMIQRNVSHGLEQLGYVRGQPHSYGWDMMWTQTSPFREANAMLFSRLFRNISASKPRKVCAILVSSVFSNWTWKYTEKIMWK